MRDTIFHQPKPFVFKSHQNNYSPSRKASQCHLQANLLQFLNKANDLLRATNGILIPNPTESALSSYEPLAPSSDLPSPRMPIRMYHLEPPLNRLLRNPRSPLPPGSQPTLRAQHLKLPILAQQLRRQHLTPFQNRLCDSLIHLRVPTYTQSAQPNPKYHQTIE